MADANDDVKQYFSDLEGAANQVVNTLNDMNTQLTQLGHGPIGVGESRKLELFAIKHPNEKAFYRQTELFATYSKHLSEVVINNAQNYYERWAIESRRNRDIELRNEKVRWIQYTHKTVRWLLGIGPAIGLYSGSVAMSESESEWLNWLKVPGRDVIEKFIERSSGGS